MADEVSTSPDQGRPTSRRWLVPIIATAALLVGAFAAPRIASADDNPSLPGLIPSQLLAKVQTAKVQGVDGEVSTTAKLGIPALPTSGPDSSNSDASSFLSGTKTFHVWASDRGDMRLQLPSSSSETDVIHSGNDLWTWESKKQEVTHLVLPSHDANKARSKDQMNDKAVDSRTQMTPQAAADGFLSAIDPTTSVSIANTTRVAGHSAYELVLTPKSTTSLIGSVRIAVDSQNFAPLRVQMFARGSSEVAYQIGYASVDFGRPDDSVFKFTPPANAKVETHDLTKPDDKKDAAKPADRDWKNQMPVTYGNGWDTIVVFPANKGAKPMHNEQLDKMTSNVSGAAGQGRILHTNLLNVVFFDDGRVAVGSTTQANMVSTIPHI